jgi:hypothetical protein
MLAQMAHKKRDRDGSAFRPKDEMDEIFAGANPNPERIGCPGGDVLRAAASKALPMQDPVYDHLTECSECYREFRQIQGQQRSKKRWVYGASAIAAALILAVGVVAIRNVGRDRWSNAATAILLDYRLESPTRSESGERPRKVNQLPRTIVHATILAPTGSEAGSYELRLVNPSGVVVLNRAALGALENSAMRIKATFDLRSLQRGRYSLQMRHAGEDWDAHPITIE